MVVHRVHVPDHGDNIGPAVDGDLSQALHILAILILVPGAVVEPAVKQETLRKLIRFVVVIDAEHGQVQNLALVHRLQRNRRIRRLHVAVAVDHHLNLLQVIDHGGQVGPSVHGALVDGSRPVADLVAPDFVPLVSGGAAGVQVVQAGQIAGLLQDVRKRGALGVIAQVLAHGGLAVVAVAVDVHIDGVEVCRIGRVEGQIAFLLCIIPATFFGYQRSQSVVVILSAIQAAICGIELPSNDGLITVLDRRSRTFYGDHHLRVNNLALTVRPAETDLNHIPLI